MADTPAVEGVQEGVIPQPVESTQPKKIKSVHRPLPVKALPNGRPQSMCGIQSISPLSGSPTSAFKQVPDDFEKIRALKQRLTRSLLSGSEKSLSSCSESEGGSCGPAPVSKPYMLRSAADAASAAIDYSKGDVEDGVVDSPPSRGPVRTPICSLSSLKRTSSARGGSFSPAPRTEAATNQKLSLPIDEGVGHPRLEDAVVVPLVPRLAESRDIQTGSQSGDFKKAEHVTAQGASSLPRLDDCRRHPSSSIGTRRLLSVDGIHTQRYLRDRRQSLSSTSTGSERPYISNANILLSRPPPRQSKSLSTSEVSQSASKPKRKDRGVDMDGALNCHYPHYPS